jgi:hypothetical protein
MMEQLIQSENKYLMPTCYRQLTRLPSLKQVPSGYYHALLQLNLSTQVVAAIAQALSAPWSAVLALFEKDGKLRTPQEALTQYVLK